MHFPLPEGELKKDLVRARRKYGVVLWCVGPVFATTFLLGIANPKPSLFWSVFLALLNIFNLGMFIGIVRSYRYVRAQLTGHLVLCWTEELGAIAIQGPRKEKGTWRITQVGPYLPWDLAKIVAPPSGKGSQFSDALFSLCRTLSPELKNVPDEEVEALSKVLEEGFRKEVARMHEQGTKNPVE